MRRLPWFLAAALAALGCGGGDGGPDPHQITVSVGDAFAPGARLKDAYGGATMTVSAERTVTLVPDPSGVALLEPDGAAAGGFDWTNVIVYFAIVDRFANGEPGNDGSYGREKDG
jgi:alpha-amylase